MKKHVRSLKSCSQAMCVGLAIGMPGFVVAQTYGFLPYQNATAIRQGRQIYEANCAVCHGADLEGEKNWRTRGEDGLMPAPPHDETGHTWHHPDMVLFRISKFGTAKVVGQGYKSNMPGFEDVLEDSEILAVLAYIKSTWPEDVIEMHNQRNQ